MSKQNFSISELASDFDITPRTIRFYEEKGLLKPRRRGQTRVYSAADRVTLKLILRGKRLGLSLEESRDIIQMYQRDHDNSAQLIKLIDTIRERKAQLKAQLQQQVQDMQDTIAELSEAEKRAKKALAAINKRAADAKT